MGNGDDASGTFGLIRREEEMLILVCDGLQAKEIANELGISVHIVKIHTQAIKWKMRAKTLAHAAAIYVAWATKRHLEAVGRTP